MGARIGIVQISHPGPTDESEHDGYWTHGLGARLRAMYADLLGMIPIYIGYHKVVHEDGHLPEIGFEYSPDDVRARWPDPAYPQQVHLDIAVRDLDDTERRVLSHGARRLAGFEDHLVFEDAAGHPFCLYPGASGPIGQIVRIVFDCFSPRALAAFYAELFDLPTRVVDTPHRVELAGVDGHLVLAFQHSLADPPRWPDPTRPHQIHLDVTFDSADDLRRVEALGGIRSTLSQRPENEVFADPAGHPFCVGVGGGGLHGPAQVEDYRRWLAARDQG